jgi:hypothetical protein
MMSEFLVLEPIEYKDDVSSCLLVKDFPGCPPGFVVIWDTEFHCHNCGQHIYEIINRKIPHECRHIDTDGKDRPVLDESGEKTYYKEDAHLIICPRCVTYWPDDIRIGEFDHREMIVILYDRVKRPEPDQLRNNRHRPAIVARTTDERFLARWRPVDPAALAELQYYNEDRKKHALSKMQHQADQAAERRSHKAPPVRGKSRGRIDREFSSDYTYGIQQQKGLHDII